MSAKELASYLQQTDPKPVIIDVREPWEYELGHLPDSILAPLGQLLHHLSDFNPEQEHIMVCHHGVRSMRAAYLMEHHGFGSIINLSGGVDAWANDVDPQFPKY